MTDMNAEILRELKEISFLLGDLNAIRNGEYDPPSGSGSSGRANGSQATPNALLKALNRIADSLDNEAERADERHAELIEVLAAIDESGLKRHTELVGVVEDLGTSLALN